MQGFLRSYWNLLSKLPSEKRPLAVESGPPCCLSTVLVSLGAATVALPNLY